MEFVMNCAGLGIVPIRFQMRFYMIHVMMIVSCLGAHDRFVGYANVESKWTSQEAKP